MKKNDEKSVALKIIILGLSDGGKTSILDRFIENKFTINTLITIGINLYTKIIKFDKFEIKLKIWDSAGQEKLLNGTLPFISGVDGIIFVCDITDYSSFDRTLRLIDESDLRNGDYVGIICANKSDLEEYRKISTEELINFGNRENFEIFETSAKTGKNINEMFMKLTYEILQKKRKEEAIKDFTKHNNYILEKNQTFNKNIKNTFIYRIILIDFNNSEIIEKYSEKRLNFRRKIIDMDKSRIKLILYNIQEFGEFEYFISLNKKINKIDGIVFSMDISSKESFERIKEWINYIKQNYKKDYESIIFVNQNEIEINKPVLSKELNDYASNQKIEVFVIYAKTEENIEKGIIKLVSRILTKQENKELTYEFFDNFVCKRIFKKLNKYIDY